MNHFSQRFLWSLAIGLCVQIAGLGQTRNGLEAFMGEWQGSGMLFGNKAEFYMKWESALDGAFVQLSFKNKIGDMPEFHGTAYYKELDSLAFTGQWFDSRGVIQSLDSKFENSQLTTFWSNPGTEKGKTIYLLVGKNEIEVTDFVWKDAQWTTFGSAKYVRLL